MAEVTIYGVEGCGPCEVAKIFFKQQNIHYRFVDLNQNPDSRRELVAKLEQPTSGVILEVGDSEDTKQVDIMQGVSLASLRRWLEQHPELT
jgi:arsenate reductase-like glutaredoxin family protein